jgi:ABC-type Fe3+ transport system permease subunit
MKISRFVKGFIIFFLLFIIVHVIVEILFGSTMQEVMATFTKKDIYSLIIKTLFVAIIYSFPPKDQAKEKK